MRASYLATKDDGAAGVMLLMPEGSGASENPLDTGHRVPPNRIYKVKKVAHDACGVSTLKLKGTGKGEKP
eukprot:scaffold47941_cov54-Phaeocystis_antarctica.AAC.3